MLKTKNVVITSIALIAALIVTCIANHVNNKAQPAMINSADYPSIIIDAGHGGFDGGAVANGIIEKDINLAISLNLRDMLTSSGFKVIMIREEDISVHDPAANTTRTKKNTDLNNRLKVINDNKDAIFVSIHQNMYTESKYSGAQVFYSPNNSSSKALAQILQDTIKGQLQNDNTRQIKQATDALYLLYNAQIPAVMVECGFLSNPEEAAKLKTSEYQQQMSFAIMSGILTYCSSGE